MALSSILSAGIDVCQSNSFPLIESGSQIISAGSVPQILPESIQLCEAIQSSHDGTIEYRSITWRGSIHIMVSGSFIYPQSSLSYEMGLDS